MGATDLRAPGYEAIQQAAQSHALPTGMSVLSQRWNLVVRLEDTDVIAKAAPIGHLARRDSAHCYLQEIHTCNFLASRGAPVQAPYTPTVWIAPDTGIPVSLWHLVPGTPGDASERQLVDSLAQLHQVGKHMTLIQPWFATITTHFIDVFALIRERRLLPGTTIQLMDQSYRRLMERLESYHLEQGFIHGDAQRKNALVHDGTVTWIDLEECSFGPLAWDLACLSKHEAFDTQRVLDRYAEVTGTDRISTAAIDALHELRDLEALTWMIAIQAAREPEFQQATADFLARWRANVD